MARVATPSLLIVLFSLLPALSGCGTYSPSSRRLQSIVVAPVSADAHNFANGQVQFTASGNFNAQPTPVTPLPVASWVSSASNIATVDETGKAQCVAGTSGSVTISAIASSGPDYNPGMGAAATAVTGTASLTCP